MKPLVFVIHNAVKDSSLPDEQDVMVQVEAVCEALETLGYRPETMPCGLDLQHLKAKLLAAPPHAVFNLVESLDGQGRLIHLVPSLLDVLRIPYTGCPAQAILVTSHKVMAKERMKAAGLTTPDWINPIPLDMPWTGAVSLEDLSERDWIIKSLWEHASLGLERENLVLGSASEIHGLLTGCKPEMGGACFAEAFIEGREFNLSILETDKGPRVLSPAEILFQGFESDTPRIVGYRAKWVPDSPEYHNTQRSFDFSSSDRNLLSDLETLALKCWRVFGLRGYARVDFRVDDQGRVYILEINANPCISPDAGFAAALCQSGIPYFHAVEHILKNRCG